ncbi:acyl-CoA dehydrogenase family protein [Pseudofrankia inefficax]|uniref:Acyl-CoA dehydrogenase domain-containing protein n=1 Tax=Pseudofrankia inefficax (strain DSM 45817 / CECT 9037 / DDB 130130 / EuI1c) TaxID=298654 RepID=E3JBZ7_PSEI1|nr:acyl-CoA dehydrogenase family protein [Pseudofrankia inefficax]ADP82307.1 acyl-CoA dehydrogenase domain-containing protein [Pseudofrankia inefficax]
MDFRLRDEQLALRDTVVSFCKGHFDVAAVASREGLAAAPGAWSELTGIGVLGMLVPDEVDGAAPGGAAEVAIAFEELGRSLCLGPVLWSTLAAPLVPGVEAGEVRVAGVRVEPGRPAGAVAVEHAAESDVLIVLYPDRVERLDTADLPVSVAGEPFDPLTPTAVFETLPSGTVVGGAEEAARLGLLGTALSAALLVGTAQGALDVAAGYAAQRKQFGVPIGSFQAVKHLLADMYVRVALARSATYAAAAMIDDPRAGDAVRAASAAKLLAGEAGIGNGRAAVQVLGGMGFTWEMLPHYYLKRAWLLEQGFGTSDHHALALADTLAAEPGVALDGTTTVVNG